MQISMTKILIAILLYSLCVQAIETKVTNLRGTGAETPETDDGTASSSSFLVLNSSTQRRKLGQNIKNLRYLSSKPSYNDRDILDETEMSKKMSQRSRDVDEDHTSLSTTNIINNRVKYHKETAARSNDSWDNFLQKEQAAIQSIVQNERQIILSSTILAGRGNDKNESKHNINWDDLSVTHQSIPETRASNIYIRSPTTIAHEIRKGSSRSTQFE